MTDTCLWLAAEFSLNVDATLVIYEHLEHFSGQRYPGAATT